jgi:hypothetical protein
MKIQLSHLNTGSRIIINNNAYEVISIEDDYWYDKDSDEIENKGLFINLHELGDSRLGVPVPTHYLYYYNKTKKFEFYKCKFEKNPKIPKDASHKLKISSKISKETKIPIKEIKQK